MPLNKDIKNKISLIAKDLAEGQHVVFLLGAGASKPIGVPLAKELKETLVADIFPGRESEFSTATLEEVISELVETRGIEALHNTQLYSELSRYGKNFSLPPASLQHLLAGISRSYNLTFISLNFDELIEVALSSINLDFKVLADDETINDFLKEWSDEEKTNFNLAEYIALHPTRIIIKPHGTISNLSSLRLTPRRTDKFSPKKEEILKKALHGSDLVVLGCSASDKDLFNLITDSEVASNLNSLLWIGKSKISEKVHDFLEAYCKKCPEAQINKLYLQVDSNEFVEELHNQLEETHFKRLTHWPRSFLPIVTLTGDRREKYPESIADLIVLSSSTSDLTWISSVGLPPKTLIRSDKITVVGDPDYLRETLGSSTLFVVGSPGTNLVARMVNSSVPFPFNIPAEVYEDEEKIRDELEKIGPYQDELLQYKEKHEDRLNALMNEFRGNGFFDPIRMEVRGTHSGASRDYGVVTVGLNPFSNKHLAVIVAGTHLPGTMGAMKLLSNPENFRQRPLGGIIRVYIPGSLPWPRRVVESRPYWDTPSYTITELDERWQTISKDNSTLDSLRVSINEKQIEAVLKLMNLINIKT